MYTEVRTNEKAQILRVVEEQLESAEYANMTLKRPQWLHGGNRLP
jgi:hypothetical protein